MTKPAIAVVGAGWAGLAAAVLLTRAGYQISLFDSSKHAGGRARSFQHPSGFCLDNGQHIMLGAYHQTLALLHSLDVNAAEAFLRTPLDLRYPDGSGVYRWFGLPRFVGWSWRDKANLLQYFYRWWRAGFQCEAYLTVAELCSTLSQKAQSELTTPLCLSALNTPPVEASAAVFLRVLHDASLTGFGSSDMLLPKKPLHDLFVAPALAYLNAQGARLHLGERITSLEDLHAAQPNLSHTVLACPLPEAQRLLEAYPSWDGHDCDLQYEAIATAYVLNDSVTHQSLARPMLQLKPSQAVATVRGADFAFDLHTLQGQKGLYAFVASAFQGEASRFEAQVLAQAHSLGLHQAKVLECIVEKRATYACRPALQRPSSRVTGDISVCGDYVSSNPYPSTLEGAVLSSQALLAQISPN